MSSSILQFPASTAKLQPTSDRPLFQDPNCPAHFTETPFVEGQASTARVQPPAETFAAGLMKRLYANVHEPDKGILFAEDVLAAYFAACYNAGYAAALDQEFAEAVAEMDPELGTR